MTILSVFDVLFLPHETLLPLDYAHAQKPHRGGTLIPRKRNAIPYALGHYPLYVACLRHAVDGPSPTLRMG
jgi:hypothetical protein